MSEKIDYYTYAELDDRYEKLKKENKELKIIILKICNLFKQYTQKKAVSIIKDLLKDKNK